MECGREQVEMASSDCKKKLRNKRIGHFPKGCAFNFTQMHHMGARYCFCPKFRLSGRELFHCLQSGILAVILELCVGCSKTGLLERVLRSNES